MCDYSVNSSSCHSHSNPVHHVTNSIQIPTHELKESQFLNPDKNGGTW